MKRRILLALALVFLVLYGISQTPEDSLAIKKTALNYIEGWYDGDVQRMDQALHPDLAKRQIFHLPQSGTDVVNAASKSIMLEYTRAGFGKQTPRDKINNKVTIMDIYLNMANVKVVSHDFVDYCHLVKYNGEWKIINVLWDKAPAEKSN